MEEKDNIQELIFKQLLGCASEEEIVQIDKWRDLSQRNNRLYHKMIDAERIRASFKVYETIDLKKAFNRIVKPQPKQIKLFSQVVKYVAAILLPLILGLGVWLLVDSGRDNPVVSDVVEPLSQKATVLLSDGQVVVLDGMHSTTIVKDGGQVVGKDSLNTLVYSESALEEEVYNTIKIPLGGEYQLVFSDGTRVWLNSGTEFRFPVSFVGETREVYLKGEAYFDVAHNPDKPFKVKTDNSVVQVYGTSFNVMSYPNDLVEQVTLVEGKVGMCTGDNQVILTPGEQAELKISNPELLVKQVETSLYIAWTGGVLKFKDMPLRELSKKLSRWYNVEFMFDSSSVGDIHFTGQVRKDVDFNYFMRLIEKTTNVKITMNGRKVLITEER